MHGIKKGRVNYKIYRDKTSRKRAEGRRGGVRGEKADNRLGGGDNGTVGAYTGQRRKE